MLLLPPRYFPPKNVNHYCLLVLLIVVLLNGPGHSFFDRPLAWAWAAPDRRLRNALVTSLGAHAHIPRLEGLLTPTRAESPGPGEAYRY